MNELSPSTAVTMLEQPSFIPIYRPELNGNERRYLNACLDKVELSNGRFVSAFETAFAEWVGARRAVSVSSGTTALHLLLHALGIGPGDEVIVPTFTFVATANAVRQTGATLVFADCDPMTWVTTAKDVAPLLTSRTKAILAVHLYGAVCDLESLAALADRHGIHLLEDCAQSLGGSFKSRHVGTWGKAGTFSFFGNKLITCGEGGMIVMDDGDLADRLCGLRNHAVVAGRRYWHEEVGFNYKMTNLAAAIGLAQLEQIDAFKSRKEEIATRYRDLLRELPVMFQTCHPNSVSPEWLFSLTLPEEVDRDAVIAFAFSNGVDIRPVFACMHEIPAHLAAVSLPCAERIARTGISLPSYPSLGESDVRRVADVLSLAIESAWHRRQWKARRQ